MIRNVSTLLLLVSLCAAPSQARIIHIPDDAETFQAAVDAAAAEGGDTILVADGNYTGQGNINISVAKPVVIISENGPDNCIIDCEDAENSRAFSISRPGSLIGFTITRSTMSGVRLDNTTPYLVEDCLFYDNNGAAAQSSGGGLHVRLTQVTVRHCRFDRNTNVGSGGGAFVNNNSTAYFDRVFFTENHADRFGGGLHVTNTASATLVNCVFSGNDATIDGGGAGASINGTINASFCTFYSNHADGMGGGLYKGSNSNPIVINSIFWGNSADEMGAQLASDDNGGEITISYCLVEGGVDRNAGWDGEAIIDEDPEFTEGRAPSLGLGQFYLDPESPAIDAGSDAAAVFGIDRYTNHTAFLRDVDQADLGSHYWIGDLHFTGRLYGTVVELDGGEPIEGVEVANPYGQSVVTDADGQWEINPCYAGVLTISAALAGWSTVFADIELEEDGEAELSLELGRPIFRLDRDAIVGELNANSEDEVQFQVVNDGNGLLAWSASTRLPEEFAGEPWERRFSYDINELTEDNQIGGVAYDGENFYISGADGQDTNKIYIVSEDGELLGHFNQVGTAPTGMRDLAWDGELLWGASGRPIIGFTTDGDSVTAFNGPFNILVGVTYDPDRDGFWMCGTTTEIIGYDRRGNRIGTVARGELRLYGLAYWPGDPDGFPLYIHANTVDDQRPMIYKANPRTGEVRSVITLDPPEGGRPEGIEIITTFDPYSVILLGIANDDADRLDAYQLASNTGWMAIAPESGEVAPGEAQNATLWLSSMGFPDGEYSAEAVFGLNTIEGEAVVPIRMVVTEGPVHATRYVDFVPGWNLISVNLQPDNNEDVPALVSPLVEEGILDYVKAVNGRFYTPRGEGFNNIETWNSQDAFWIRVSARSRLGLEGTTVRFNDPIDLPAGWQGLSYYPRGAMDPVEAFAGVADRMRIVKDGSGFYLPAYNFNSMSDCRPGKGYMIRMDEAAEFVWGGGAGAASIGRWEAKTPKFAPAIPATGADMSLLLLAAGLDGYEIVIRAGDVAVGSAVVSGGKAGVSLRGDDPATTALDGARDGDALSVELISANGDLQVVKTRLVEGELAYRTNSLTVLEAAADVATVRHTLIETYPNPFNAELTVRIELPEASSVRLALFDLNGREVRKLDAGRLEIGSSRLILSAADLSAGLYWLRVETGSTADVRKVALVK